MKSDNDTFKVGGSKAAYVLTICSLLNLVNYMDRQVMGVVLEPVKIEFGLSDSQAGLLTTILVVGIVIFVVPVSHLVDRWSRKKTIALLAIFWSLFTFLTGLMRSFPLLIATRLAVGIGEAGFSPGSTALISASYPEEKRALKLGIYSMFITVGSIMGVAMGGYISAHFGGWRVPFFTFAGPGIVLGIMALFMQDYKTGVDPSGSAHASSFIDGVRRLIAIPSLRWLWLGYGLYSFFITATITWIPALLMRTYGYREDKAGLILGIVALIGLVGAPLGGIIADRMQKRTKKGRMILASAAVFTAAVTLLLTLATMSPGAESIPVPTFVILVAYGLTNTMAIAPLMATTQDVITPDLKGKSWGMSMLANNLLGGAWGPVAVGALSDLLGGGSHGLRVALAITAVMGMGTAIFWRISIRHCPADIDAATNAGRSISAS